MLSKYYFVSVSLPDVHPLSYLPLCGLLQAFSVQNLVTGEMLLVAAAKGNITCAVLHAPLASPVALPGACNDKISLIDSSHNEGAMSFLNDILSDPELFPALTVVN